MDAMTTATTFNLILGIVIGYALGIQKSSEGDDEDENAKKRHGNYRK